MKAVGIRELKARLSHYLRDVQGGDVVLVTDRGRVVAELRPPGNDTRSLESATERALRLLAEAGGLLIGEPHDPGAYTASPVEVAEGTVAELLAEERDEG
jgi:antitoxin (DNA-binding transcriptional repressor) of toxin-antitoxin stability system